MFQKGREYLRRFKYWYEELPWWNQQPFHVPIHIVGGMLFGILFGLGVVMGWAVGLEFGQGFRLREQHKERIVPRVDTERVSYELQLLLDASLDIAQWVLGALIGLHFF